MLKYQIVPVTPFQQNCTLLWCDATSKAVIVDPGGDADLIMNAVSDNNLIVDKVLLTHGHLDHVGVAKLIAHHYDVDIIGPHRDDLFWLDSLPLQSRQFGLQECAPFLPDLWLEDNNIVHVGNEELLVLHCPGHTPGHVVFYSEASKLALVGDVLFSGSIGRTDFPKGNYDQLINSIRTKLFTLGDDVTFISGHGPMSTIAHERQSNPFVGGL